MNKKIVDVTSLENESPKGKLNKVVNNSTIDASNVEWLIATDAMEHLDETNLDIVSSKYDPKREPKVQEGLKALEGLEINGEKLNPLVLLLGKWWEHKPVRKEIKNLIDAEAIEKGYEPSYYLQEVLGKQIEVFAEFQTAIDRIKYAKTYFIPRGGIKTSLKTKQLRIDGDLFNVPIAKLNEIMTKYPDHKTNKKQGEALRKEVKEISTLVDTIEEL